MSKTETQLEELPPEDILKNPDNPRILFDEDSLEILRKSIEKNGILVPLLVFRRNKDGKFVLLDGERRWRCAKDLRLPKVPVHIIPEPSKVENILTMFNIHNIREQWDLVPTALKLEVLMRLMKTDSVEDLVTATSLSEPEVVRCLNLLTYPRKYLDMSLVGDEKERISGHFFAELKPPLDLMLEFPEIKTKYSRLKLIDRMLEKYQAKEIRSVLEFRDLTKLIRSVDKGASRPAVLKTVQFILDSDVGIRESFKASVKIVYDVEKLYKTCRSLKRSLSKIEPSQVESDSAFVRGLSELRDTINRFLHSVK